MHQIHFFVVLANVLGFCATVSNGLFLPWNKTFSISIHQQQLNQSPFVRQMTSPNQQQQQQQQRFIKQPSETDETSLHHLGESQKKQWLAPGGGGGMMPPPMFNPQPFPDMNGGMGGMGGMDGGLMNIQPNSMLPQQQQQQQQVGSQTQPTIKVIPPKKEEEEKEEIEEDKAPDVNSTLSIMDQILQVNVDPDLDFPATIATDSGELFELFEGDIIRNKKLEVEVADMKKQKNTLRLRGTIESGHWANGIVPYAFHANFSDNGRQVVATAMKLLEDNTCINFKPRTKNEGDYIAFENGGGCASMIGRQGGRQIITLGSSCLIIGIALHEIMHALGFFHEQSRRDRDKFIKINWTNINKRMWYNFQRYRKVEESDEPYDKDSIMHYGNYAFSMEGDETIESKSDKKQVLGQRIGLSHGDVKRINKKYNCPKDIGIGVNPDNDKSGNTSNKEDDDEENDEEDDDENNTKSKQKAKALKDQYAFCFKIVEFCASEKWVKENCKKTCCQDQYNFCPDWQKEGYCFKDQNKQWMKSNCPKSCGYC